MTRTARVTEYVEGELHIPKVICVLCESPSPGSSQSQSCVPANSLDLNVRGRQVEHLGSQFDGRTHVSNLSWKTVRVHDDAM